MNLLKFFTFVVLSLPVFASNPAPINVVGSWVSNWVAVKGETQTISFSNDMSSIFTRTFEKGESQIFKSSSAEVFEDIVVVKYNDEENKLRYKLILSGWVRENRKVLYGTMFMYDKGNQFNGLPVSFLGK